MIYLRFSVLKTQKSPVRGAFALLILLTKSKKIILLPFSIGSNLFYHKNDTILEYSKYSLPLIPKLWINHR